MALAARVHLESLLRARKLDGTLTHVRPPAPPQDILPLSWPELPELQGLRDTLRGGLPRGELSEVADVLGSGDTKTSIVTWDGLQVDIRAVEPDRLDVADMIRNADQKNLLGLSRAINDLGNRARSKKLNPDEVQGGTFTITNPGIFGALYGLPLINQPQVAILGVGAIEKRAVVVDDAIAIRPMGYLTLGYDHRLIDGAVADQFLSTIKGTLEQFDPAWV